MEVAVRFFLPPGESFFLFGPRGTGKSTLLKSTYPKCMLIDLLEPDLLQQYRARPMRLKELVLANPSQSPFIIDEVQKVPELLSVVHQLIEMKRGWQFILTGSSSRKLKRTGVDLLAGRAQLKHLHPFMASEIAGSFDLTRQLKLGMLPLIVNAENPTASLKAYIALYIREEVQMEGIIRKVEQLSRFLEAMSFSQAAQINYANIARDCGVSGKTVENYVYILEDLLLSFKLPIFDKLAKRHLTAHPKFYFFDVGVFRSLRPMGPLDNPEAIEGQALETLLAAHLRAWLDYSDQDGKLYFWRTKSGLEVDFIIYGEIGFYAIELKRNAQVKIPDLRGLLEFKADYPESTPLFLYGGTERLLVEGVLCLPLTEFLLHLKPQQPLVVV
ncbi:MAG: ATPase [Gammaproteobacteria bacterium RIFCSPHIGHO2_12_FULL_45_9]|nr:MAG: ATPase [Gammaproteobacteria bacterium RIFCSPHIGHO2_12_FULL_45_9]